MSMTESERLTRREEDDLFSVYLRKALIERLADYEDIGTVSEFRELKEKATAKKPELEQVEIDYYEYDCLECPNCGSFIGYATECEEEHYQIGYCPYCGQHLDWSEGKE